MCIRDSRRSRAEGGEVARPDAPAGSGGQSHERRIGRGVVEDLEHAPQADDGRLLSLIHI